MAQAKIIITAQDKTKQGINSAKSNLQGLNEIASSLGINLSKLTATGAVVAGLMALAKGAKECASAFLETENTYLTLKNSFGNTSEYNKAITSIDKLSKTTLASQEDVAKLYTTLVQLGKSDTEIKKIITASISLSNVTGKSLNESFNVMLDSLDGSIGTLQKYLPEVKELTKEELALGEAVDLVNDAFSDVSKSTALSSVSQTIKNMKDDLNSVKENVGYLILESLAPAIEALADSISYLKTVSYQKRTIDNLVEGKSKDSVESAIAKGYKNGGTQWYAQQRINTAEDAYIAMDFLSEMQNAGLLDGEEEQAFRDRILSLCEQIVPNIEGIYKKTQIQQGNYINTASEQGINGSVGVWGKNTHTEDQVTTALNAIMDEWFELTDSLYEKAGIPVDFGSNYGDNDTDRQRAVHDYEIFTNKLKEYNDIFRNYRSWIEKELKSLGYSEAQIASAIDNYFVSFWRMHGDTIATYLEVAENLGTDIDSAIGSLGSKYLSSFGQDIYDSYIFEQNLESLQELVDLSKRIYGDDDYRTIILKDMLDNMEKGVDVTLESSVKSTLGANKSYLSDETAKEYEIATLQNDLDKMQETFDKAVEQMNLGVDEYTDLELEMMKEIIDGRQKELDELKNPSPDSTTTTSSFDSFTSEFGNIFKDTFDSAFDTQSIDTSLFDSLSGSLGSLYETIEPLVNVIMASNPFIALLIMIVKEMAEILSPFLEDTIKPFTDLIHTLAESLSGWITSILNVVKGVLAEICDCLEMVLLPVLEIITPIIQAICGILNVFKPVMEWLKNCFMDISTIITFVADAIKFAIWSFLNWMDGLKIWKWRPFEGVGGYDVSTLDSYDSNTGGLSIGATKKSLQEKFAYDVTDWTATNGGQDTSTSTSVKTASYTGSNNYYFNIYQQAPVVGDGGMQEFAKMIKMEFAELAYIGA